MGFNGGVDPVYSNELSAPSNIAHDAAAVLLEDGNVVAGVEEERLTRIKHTNKAPLSAIRACLDVAGIGPEDVDRWVFSSAEESVDRAMLFRWHQNTKLKSPVPARAAIQGLFERHLGFELPPDRLEFVHHHTGHAMSAFGTAGFESSLVVTWDGLGDGLSGTVWTGRGHELTKLTSYTEKASLGKLYVNAIRFLGYEIFDEYKVMGLAPYGDPARYRRLFDPLCTLKPDGEYDVHLERLMVLFQVCQPRGRGEEFAQEHKDLAASLQETLERIAFHILEHWRRETGERRVCLAGGVAHNCTLNGKILRSGLFDEVFVQPAAHDAGCALGAALTVHARHRQPDVFKRLGHVYWGADIGAGDAIGAELRRWGDWVDHVKLDRTAERAAELLARGKVIGWVQGRSEFGPRALGNRSIIADPRPASNKRIINEMVKKREDYRPFAPSVLEERIEDYFLVPGQQKRLPYMNFVVEVKEHARAALGAITHVDGSARIQTVSRDENRRYWELIKAFGDITGVYVLLNTSFNNNVEPIVDSVHDAIVSFLTTKLDHLVVGDYLVTKRPGATSEAMKRMLVALPRHIRVRSTRGYEPGGLLTRHECVNVAAEMHNVPLSEAAFHALSGADGKTTLGALLARAEGRRAFPGVDAMIAEISALWSQRVVVLSPAVAPVADRGGGDFERR
ncbi:carbamoyltransferase family protein [Sorangium sp. So ce124]|uniref:carbamoyltransferase family protein n=1 Tax=Sorangium sp. So ce124 TaxID=3133280 RepID=UPI003F642549